MPGRHGPVASEVTGCVVTVKVLLVVPAATVTLAGTFAFGLVFFSGTTAPPAGADPLNTILPADVPHPPITVVGVRYSCVSFGGTTVSVFVTVTRPYVAEINVGRLRHHGGDDVEGAGVGPARHDERRGDRRDIRPAARDAHDRIACRRLPGQRHLRRRGLPARQAGRREGECRQGNRTIGFGNAVVGAVPIGNIARDDRPVRDRSRGGRSCSRENLGSQCRWRVDGSACDTSPLSA